jgi:hypothetical protein
MPEGAVQKPNGLRVVVPRMDGAAIDAAAPSHERQTMAAILS